MWEFIVDIFRVLNEVITLGGASEARRALEDLRKANDDYQALYEEALSTQKRRDEIVAGTGASLLSVQVTLERVQTVLRRSFIPAADIQAGVERQMLNDILRFKENVHTSIGGRRLINLLGLGLGSAAGSAVSIGSWALVASVGAASTGTAISTLSGVAATNAILAWFGGGAIAAGGAGMAAGGVVIAVLAIGPLVAFSAWLTYRQARKYRQAHQEISEKYQELEIAYQSLLDSIIEIERRGKEICEFCSAFESQVRVPLEKLESRGWWKKVVDRLSWWPWRAPLTDEEVEARLQLIEAVTALVPHLERNGLLESLGDAEKKETNDG